VTITYWIFFLCINTLKQLYFKVVNYDTSVYWLVFPYTYLLPGVASQGNMSGVTVTVVTVAVVFVYIDISGRAADA